MSKIRRAMIKVFDFAIMTLLMVFWFALMYFAFVFFGVMVD